MPEQAPPETPLLFREFSTDYTRLPTLPRTALVEKLHAAVKSSRFVLLSAPSGYGKTTLMNLFIFQNPSAHCIPISFLKENPNEAVAAHGLDVLHKSWQQPKDVAKDQPVVFMLDDAQAMFDDKMFWNFLIEDSAQWLPANDVDELETKLNAAETNTTLPVKEFAIVDIRGTTTGEVTNILHTPNRVTLARGQTLPVVLSELSTGLKSTLGRLPGENKENKKLQNMLPTANTDGDDSGNSSSDRPVKKRKATYLVNKEEKARLNHEVQELEAQLAALKDRVGLTGGQSLDKVATSNVVLSNVLRQQQLLVATAQAGLAACTRGSPNPLYSYIHLGVDHGSRRQTLSAIREFKIQNGVDYLETRSCHLDLLQPYSSSEEFVDAQGNFCCSLFNVTQFTGVKSLREVYEAAMFHFWNEEISISERLGCITVRDDYDAAGDNFCNCRLSSADEDGVKTEVNLASFAHYVDAEHSDTNEPLAVLVRDSVDVDELYPYSPDECVRKDEMGAILLTAIRRKTGPGGDQEREEEELIVVMRSAGFVKIHSPTFPLSERIQRGLLKGMTAFDVMLASMRGVISTSS
ncbi:hypothetical protein PC122_g8796 [Phytophthora cactorum]|nr:hypothetical protein PC122_g8796 [Phytophthora cactorum]